LVLELKGGRYGMKKITDMRIIPVNDILRIKKMLITAWEKVGEASIRQAGGAGKYVSQEAVLKFVLDSDLLHAHGGDEGAALFFDKMSDRLRRELALRVFPECSRLVK